MEALIGNVGTMIAFRIGEQDSRLLVERFGPEFSAADLINQDNYVAAVRTLADGQVLRPFTLFTDPPIDSRGQAWATQLRAESAARYGSPPKQRSLHFEPERGAEAVEATADWEPE